MSLPHAKSVSSATDQKLLRFGCPACGVRLVVDQSIAGTEGPCPSCGANIVAPPLDVSSDITPRRGAPVAVKPRHISGSSSADSSELDSVPVIPASEAKYQPSRRRSVSPNTVISQKYKETSNALLFFKILAAILVVALIVAAVYLVLREGV